MEYKRSSKWSPNGVQNRANIEDNKIEKLQQIYIKEHGLLRKFSSPYFMTKFKSNKSQYVEINVAKW